MSVAKLTLIIPEEDFDVLMIGEKDEPFSTNGTDVYVANRVPEKDMIKEGWLDFGGGEVAIQVTVEKVLRRAEVPKLIEVHYDK